MRNTRRVHALALVLALAAACQDPERPPEPISTVRSALESAKRITSGYSHSCALLYGGRVACWGDGAVGQLGDGTFRYSGTPVFVAGLVDAVALSADAAAGHTCALRAGGGVVCWGWGEVGQLGHGAMTSAAAPVAVSGLSDAVAITVGGNHSCALRADGEVRCWGLTINDQLGDTLGQGLEQATSTPVVVAGLGPVTAIGAGTTHTCAVRAGGTVACWGAGNFGQLGNGSFATSLTPVPVTGISDAIAVTGGWQYGCALRATGAIACWGTGTGGELGTPVPTTSAVPVAVTGVADAVELRGGGFHVCARRQAGGIVCWGDGTSGQLGQGSSTVEPTPIALPGSADATSVGPGGYHTCFVHAGGTVACTGWGLEGELGFGDPASSPTPVATGLTDATKVACGWWHTCAIRASGQGACWGYGGDGELGNQSTASSGSPVGVVGLAGATDIVGGGTHSCAITAGGGVSCWGWGSWGQLGDGNGTSSATPVPVAGLSNVTSLSAHVYHTCARRDAGDVLCWGRNFGQVGDGTTNASLVPVAVSGLAGALDVAVGARHSCATRANGHVVCWGQNLHGQLGYGGTADWLLPAEDVAGIADAVSVSSGGLHTCALRATGNVACWGWTFGAVPVPIPGLGNVVKLAGGGEFTCALRATGRIACWGTGGNGELGNGAASDATVPVDVAGIDDAISVSAGSRHACAVRAGGQTVCWGWGLTGALGNGATTALFATPVAAVGLGDNLGQPCAGAGDCVSGFCVDGVCCASACGGGAANDCQACSVAAGAGANGTCALLPSTKVCRPLADACDIVETCSGTPLCPADTKFPSCTPEPVPMCLEPACSSATVELGGGTDTVGGIDVTFDGDVTAAGSIAVVQSGAGAAPPTGFRIAGTTGPMYWNINTTAGFTPPAIVCIHYDETWILGDEADLQMGHDEGSGVFDLITTDLDTVNNIICGFANSFSPFVILEPLDTEGPSFGGVPETIVAFATTTAGAAVGYTAPTAADDFDGAVPVACAPTPGSMFPPGKTTVTCTASDRAGNASTTSFTVWVQYQAPSDGSFFLFPIRPDGSSAFRVGRPVPTRFRLQGASKDITSLVAHFSVTKISDVPQGAADSTSDETVDDTDFVFKYRPILKWYVYRWKTRDQAQGTYRLRADLGDGVIHEVNVSLKPPR